jgi:hypothetical protein
VLNSIGAADDEMLRTRDGIVQRLEIVRLPVPAPALR